jgi:heavy metal sensor kinase
VVCLAIGSYSVFSHEAYTELDSALNVAASATAMSAAHELDEHQKQQDGERDLEDILDLASGSLLPDTQILIRQGDRTVAHKATPKPDIDLSEISSARLFSQRQIDGLRIIASQIKVPKFHLTYHIFAAASVQPTLTKLRKFRGILVVCVPLGLALAALCGYLLAQRSLAPLNELTETIEAITSADLSARVRLHKAPSDFEWLASRFNSLLDRLEKAFHFQRQFMADASHELRTPLTVALSATQVTARDQHRTKADFDDTLSLVEEQIHRLRKIVDNMLFLSQVDACSLHLERHEFYLDDAINEAARAAKALARTKQQSLRIAELPEAACVGDEGLCKQAVLILLDNAVKYTPPAGDVQLTLSGDGRQWRVRVWNNGPAIPAHQQSHIFERFFRASHSSAEKTSGSGLGLPIARSIAETHGGRLELTQSNADGTVFEMVLPAIQSLTQSVTQDDPSQAKSLAVKI